MADKNLAPKHLPRDMQGMIWTPKLNSELALLQDLSMQAT